jgi:hypothetical protein
VRSSAIMSLTQLIACWFIFSNSVLTESPAAGRAR